MPLIPFPNVPALPGVPNIPRDPIGAAAAIITISSNFVARAQVQFLMAVALPPAWGLVDEAGAAVLVPDTFQAFGQDDTSQLATYPIEQGSFGTYNKTDNPFVPRVLMTKGGSDAERYAFLEQVKDLRRGLDLLTLITPEGVYRNINLVAFNYTKTNRAGANLLHVDLIFNEVRLAPAAQYSEPDGETEPITEQQTNSVNAPSPIAGGQTQSTSPTGYAAGVYNLTGVQ